MIDFKVCRKCDKGIVEPGEEMGVRPSVECELTGEILLMNSDCPEDCPFSLEHKLSTQDVPQGFANYMSGYRRKNEA